MIKKFKSLKEFNEYTNNRQWMKSGEQYWIEDQGQLYFLTNNIDGETKTYEMMDEIPEGYIVPTGNKEITENGEGIDVSEFATASVDVPIPEGYIIPSGNKEITANGTNIDVNDYATATVAVPQPSGNISITENGENIDIAQYATATVNVEAQSKDYFVEGVEYDPTETGTSTYSLSTLKHFLKNVIIPSGYTSIGNSAFLDADRLESVTIPNTITSIGYGTFANCTNLSRVNSNVNGECIIPNNVTTIGDAEGMQKGAFQYCSSLTSVTIPNSVTGIGYQCFFYCTGLTSVTIGSGVTKISTGAFLNSGPTITILATTPPRLGANALSGSRPIYVPAESVDAYKAATNWSTYADRIQAIPTE